MSTGRLFHALTIHSEKKEDLVEQHERRLFSLYGCPHEWSTSEARPYPVYLGVTLDRTLSYREHLTRRAAKLKSINNMIVKLAGTSWAASASTLCTSALAPRYSVAEYCCPVWARSSYTDLIGSRLHSLMRLTSGCLQPTQLSWLPVLSNVAPTSLRRKPATDNMLQIIETHPDWPVYADVFEHPPARLVDTITQ